MFQDIPDEENPDFIDDLQVSLLYGIDDLTLDRVNSSLEHDKHSVSGWAYKATLLDNLKKYDEAVESWQKAIELDEDNYYLLLMLTSSLDNSKRFDESYAISEKILENCVDDNWTISFLTSISMTALHLKKYDVVITSSRRAMDMLVKQNDEVFEETYQDLCSALYLSHNFNDAEIVANNGLQKFPNNVSLHTRMGQILIAQKKYQKAIPFFERSLVINSKNDETWFEMAKAYSGLNNIQRILDCLLITFSLNSTYKQNILEDKIFSELKDHPEFQRIFNLSY